MAGPFFGHADADITADIYGCLAEDADGGLRTETITTGGTYQGWKFATEVAVSGGMASDVSDATADHLTIPATGADYAISYSVTWSPVTADTQTLKAAIYLDGVQQANTIKRARLDGLSNFETTAATAIFTLAASDEISLRWTSSANSNQIQFANVSLTAVRLK